MFFSFCDDVIDLTRQTQPFFRGRHQFTRRRIMSTRVREERATWWRNEWVFKTFWIVWLRGNVIASLLKYFYLILNFSGKESASNWIDFGSQMRGLNSETISICGGNLGDFWEFLQRLCLPKALALTNMAWESMLKLTIKEIVWWCASIKWRGLR